jgi:hypothetical protein
MHECGVCLEDECAQSGGHWHPEWTTCDPNPCEIYTPVSTTTWGAIKMMYK